MKRIYLLALILAVLMLACNVPGGTPVPPTQEPPETPAPADTPTVEATPTLQLNVSCNELSFYLDPALAAGFTCETVPAANGPDPWMMYPQHTRVNLQGYVLAGTFHDPRIVVYHLPELLALRPEYTGFVDSLRDLVGGGAPGAALPLIEPSFNAGQVFHAQFQLLPFATGSGIRFATLYAQYFAEINNHDMFYAFSGMTADEQYWISAVLPLSHPSLPAEAGMDPPGGMSWEDWGNQFPTYAADVSTQLNAQPDASFLPSLMLLDSMIQSIVITP
ncbi:MAG: hypothetical protein ACK2UB_00145 [Anaerolineales bacterium]